MNFTTKNTRKPQTEIGAEIVFSKPRRIAGCDFPAGTRARLIEAVESSWTDESRGYSTVLVDGWLLTWEIVSTDEAITAYRAADQALGTHELISADAWAAKEAQRRGVVGDWDAFVAIRNEWGDARDMLAAAREAARAAL